MWAAQAHRLETVAARLRALDPRNVLRRGYAWLSDETGRAIVSVVQLEPGMSVHASVADGEADVVVRQVKPTPTT